MIFWVLEKKKNFHLRGFEPFKTWLPNNYGVDFCSFLPPLKINYFLTPDLFSSSVTLPAML